MRYDNPTKETWRGWAWNQVASRTDSSGVTRRRVVVLAGDIAGDQRMAIRHNMECIAVDLRQDAVDAFRDAGGTAIRDDVFSQIRALRPHAAILDFTGGWTASTARTFLDACWLCDCVVVNLLRGRDAIKADSWNGFDGDVIAFQSGKARNWRPRSLPPRHRGHLALWGLLSTWQVMYFPEENLHWNPHHAGMTAKQILWSDTPKTVGPWMQCAGAMVLRPSFNSYRSRDGGQYFDSLAITTTAVQPSGQAEQKIRKSLSDATIRKAAAAKAILTQRRRRRILDN